MLNDYSEDQLIQKTITEVSDRLLPKLVSREMEVFLENYPAV